MERTLYDTEALDRIHATLSGSEWDADTLEIVGQLIELTGRRIAAPGENIEARPVTTDTLRRILRPTDVTVTPGLAERVLVWTDDHRGRDRVLRWQGPCLACGTQTWAFDDGENDPRGVLGNAALDPVYVERGDHEYPTRTCTLCANDYDRYQQIQAAVSGATMNTAQPYNWGKDE